MPVRMSKMKNGKAQFMHERMWNKNTSPLLLGVQAYNHFGSQCGGFSEKQESFFFKTQLYTQRMLHPVTRMLTQLRS